MSDITKQYDQDTIVERGLLTMTKPDFTIGLTYKRGQQERTIIDVTDKVIYYVTKTDKKTNAKYKRDYKHGCSIEDFVEWPAKASTDDSIPQEQDTPKMTNAQKRATYLSRGRQYFKYRAEKLREDFEFDNWAYQGLNWGDWDNYIVRLVCHSLGVCTIDQLDDSQINEANILAIRIIDLIFGANEAILNRNALMQQYVENDVRVTEELLRARAEADFDRSNSSEEVRKRAANSCEAMYLDD